MARTIQSPGVEVKEVDLSLRPQLPVGTTVFIPGFANQGPTDELLTLSSLSEFEQVYGLPQNAAERYMYHTVKAVFQSPANVLVSRLPYGLGAGSTVADKYSVQVFPVVPRPVIVDGAAPEINSVAKDTRRIAWFPTELDATDTGGDFVLAQSASAKNAAQTIDFVTVETGDDKNDYQLTINFGASDNQTVDGNNLTLNFAAANADGATIVTAINDGVIGDHVVASGGLADTPAVIASETVTVSLSVNGTANYEDVEVLITASAAGANGNVSITGNDTDDLKTLLDAAGSGSSITFTVSAASDISGRAVENSETVTLTSGADLIPSADRVSTQQTINFEGGVSRHLSTKVVPEGEWRFGGSQPSGDYTRTTLKDAVDSVLASLQDDTIFGEPLSAFSQDDRFWNEATPGDPLSIPALRGYEIPQVSDLIAAAVNSVGWDLSASDRYYLGEPSNIELDNDNFQKTIKGQVKLKESEAGKYENQKFSTYEDLLNRGGAGLMIVNDKKFVINEKFEGYYIGISDNTNLNPASDFDSVGKLKSLSKKLGGTTGGYVDVPDQSAGTKSRLTFSLSAGMVFDEFGNKQQVGLDGSMSEVLENLSEFDLNTDEFSDVLTLAVFKVRQSTLEPDATKLDYLVADSVVGSVNYFREQFKSDGGTAVSYFIESEAENSNNLYMKFNEGISKTAGNWLDENGFPTRKIRILPAKDVRYWNEKTQAERDALAATGVNQEVNDFRVSQSFLNGQEESEDRTYIKSFQGLQRGGQAQVKHANNVYPHGVYRKQMAEARETGNIPAKLDRIFELADNFDLFPIDITVEGGLGTIYVGSKGGTQGHFDDEEFFPIGEHVVSSTGLSGSGLYQTKLIDNRSEIDFLNHYDTIFDTFKSFSQFARKDNIFIADPLRYIFVQGRNSKVLTSKQRESGVNFSQHIYWPLRHMMTGGAKNSSYCTTYANWGFTNDKALNRGVWVPMSGFAAAAMASTDANFNPWIAPAGFTRGLISGVSDIAYYPKQKERDQLYKLGLNPIANFPNEGFAIFGQKTMQSKPSAFDRINVRRLFIYLQKAVMNTVKYFVFEPNTLFTRTQVLNVLRPIFEEVKNTQGMYDYLIVCDDRNNSPDVIDRNELVVDIYIKPTRAAEFILVNFYATRTGQDFSELVS